MISTPTEIGKMSVFGERGADGNGVNLGHANEHSGDSPALSEPASDEANKELVNYMMRVLEEGRIEAGNLYGRLKWSYWLLITLSVVLFLFGLALLSSPLWIRTFLGMTGTTTLDWFTTFFPATLGIADLFALYLYNPIGRINRLMGDISQIVVVLNSYHISIALRSVEINSADRPTIGAAADHVRTLTKGTLILIEDYFGDDTSKNGNVDR